MIKLLDNKGFSLIEISLMIIILVIIGFGGYYIYRAHHQVASNKTIAVAGQRATYIATDFLKATSSIPVNHDVSIDTYVNHHISDGYFSPSFKTSVDDGTELGFSGGSPIACSNGVFPTRFGVDQSTLQGNTATVMLTLFRGNSNITKYESYIPKVTLQYTNNNWTIEGYTCTANVNFRP